MQDEKDNEIQSLLFVWVGFSSERASIFLFQRILLPNVLSINLINVNYMVFYFLLSDAAHSLLVLSKILFAITNHRSLIQEVFKIYTRNFLLYAFHI